jgi:peroxidase
LNEVCILFIKVHHYLFKSPYQSWGLDLIGANLWRGRDHGIAGYNFYLEACGSKRAANFDELLAFMRPTVNFAERDLKDKDN